MLFAILTLTIGIAANRPAAVGASLALVAVLYLLSGLGLNMLARQAGGLRWVMVATLLPQVVFLPVATAAINTSRVMLVILACALLSMTTRVPDMLATCERALGPLRRFGVDPALVGLTLALTLTTIPTIVRFGYDIRDAQRARGVPLRPQTFVVPLLVASLRHADHLTESLAARGAA